MTRTTEREPFTSSVSVRSVPRVSNWTRALSKPGTRDLLLLTTIAVVYTVTMTYLCLLRFENFLDLNWDLGINQQMLWTTNHGRLLFETGDFEFSKTQSFLQLHSTYLALVVVPLYSAYPNAITLFALQSAAVAASAFPLYFIARRVIRSSILVLLLVVLYLSNFAVVSALFYDFHWEAFIPLEFLSFFYLVGRRRYAVSLIPMVLGMVTIEVFPFLVVGVVFLFIYERVSQASYKIASLIRDRDARILVTFLAVAAISYVLIRVAQNVLIPQLLGLPVVPGGTSQSLAAGLQLSFTPTTLAHSTVYWLLLLGIFAFFPLLSPRHLILSVPWLMESVLLAPYFSNNFGDQYALIAVAPLAVAAVYGLGWLERWGQNSIAGAALTAMLFAEGGLLVAFATAGRESRVLLSGSVGTVAWLILLAPVLGVMLLFRPWRLKSELAERTTFTLRLPRVSRALRRVGFPVQVGIVAFALLFGAVMSPLNPTNSNATQYPGYYGFTLSENPVAGQMSWVLGHMPNNAQVLASDNLFPFVANNPNAYSVTWYPVVPNNPPYFPFTSTNVPRFILIDSVQSNLLPSFLQADLWNASVYGLVAFVYYQPYPGNVYLFAHGYAGKPDVRTITPVPEAYYFTAANLSIGASGSIVQDSSEKFGVAIVSHGAANPSGIGNCIWYGPYAVFLPGSYRVTINVTGGLLNSSLPATTQVLLVTAGVDSAGISLYWVVVTAAILTSSHWVNLEYNVSFAEPYPRVEFGGYLIYTHNIPNGYVRLNYIEVSSLS